MKDELETSEVASEVKDELSETNEDADTRQGRMRHLQQQASADWRMMSLRLFEAQLSSSTLSPTGTFEGGLGGCCLCLRQESCNSRTCQVT